MGNLGAGGSRRTVSEAGGVWRAAALVTAIVLLAGCGAVERVTEAGRRRSALAAGFNDADLAFLDGLGPHLGRSIALAELVPSRTDRAELVAFDDTIRTIRSQEADTVRGLLTDAGLSAPEPGDSGEEALPGTISEAELSALDALRGDDFDRAFLGLMTAQNQATVAAAEQAIEDGERPEAAALAAQIIDVRRDELAQMQYWGQQWQLLDEVAPEGLGPAARGPQVLALEQRLESLHFDVGAVDDQYTASTAHAVTAFQKLAGLPASGRATQDVLDRLDAAQPPAPLVPGGGATRVEIDLPRQVLLLYQDDRLFRVLSTSTGSGERYCEGGDCAIAVTPAGAFRVSRRIDGWRTSDLGRLYNPLYFNGGIAIHGFPTVPATPASHGCVRIPMSAAEWFPDRVPSGTPVYVLDGKTPLAPLPPAPGA